MTNEPMAEVVVNNREIFSIGSVAIVGTNLSAGVGDRSANQMAERTVLRTKSAVQWTKSGEFASR